MELSLKLTNAVITFLNDRKGMHVNDLDEYVQIEFRADLRKDIQKILEKEIK